MEPTQQTGQPPNNTTEKDQQYAEAVAKMAALDYELEHKNDTKQKHIISKKMLIYIVISIVLSIIVWVYFAITNKDPLPGVDDSKTTEQLLETTKELQELNTQ